MNIVIVNCFDTWEQRVDLLYKVLTEGGHKVRVFCSDYRHFEKIRRTESKTGYKFFTAEPYKKNLSLSRLHSHIQLSNDIFSYIENNVDSIDLLWVLAPPNQFVADSTALKRKYSHLKLIIDLIDLWPETMPFGMLKSMLGIWKQKRDKNLKYADIVVTECNLYREVLGSTLSDIKTETLYFARESKIYQPNLQLPKNELSLCYLGSINNIIDINCISEIIKSIRKVQNVTLHIIGDGERKDKLKRKASRAGAVVIDHGKIYDAIEKQKIMDQCHFGLNIMKKTVCVGLTMKSIDYFEGGLPIINNIHGDTWEAVEKFDLGINWNKQNNIIYQEVWRVKSREFFEKYLTENIFKEKVSNLLAHALIYTTE